VERADLERSGSFTRLRDVMPDGELRAVSELERVATRHGESKVRRAPPLALADLTRSSLDYVADHPPRACSSIPARSGPRGLRLAIYEMVASRDGAPEKIEAAPGSRRSSPFAVVDRDRFTP